MKYKHEQPRLVVNYSDEQGEDSEITLNPKTNTARERLKAETELVDPIKLSSEEMNNLDAMVHVLVSQDGKAKYDLFDFNTSTEKSNDAWAWYLYRAVATLSDHNATMRQLFKNITSMLGGESAAQHSNESLASIFNKSISNLQEALQFFSGETTYQAKKKRRVD